MHFDLLDDSCAMVKSILPFEELDQTGLTGLEDSPVVPILVVNTLPCTESWFLEYHEITILARFYAVGQGWAELARRQSLSALSGA